MVKGKFHKRELGFKLKGEVGDHQADGKGGPPRGRSPHGQRHGGGDSRLFKESRVVRVWGSGGGVEVCLADSLGQDVKPPASQQGD